MALLEKQRSGVGQVVDVALYESMFNLMEAVVPEFDGNGVVREPSGSTVTGIVPTNTYRCRDDRYIVIGGNGDSIFERLMIAADCPQMAGDPRLASNQGRVEHEAEIDAVLAKWCAAEDSATLLQKLEAARVPSGPIYNVRDMLADPHFNARGLFETVEINGEPLKIPALLPRLSRTPGSTRWPGAELGSANAEILEGLLGLDEEKMAELRAAAVIL
jgi:crotonobetainyl-CoA:carnitine CoA-transferase CaiB-like acyl-CoA transferase